MVHNVELKFNFDSSVLAFFLITKRDPLLGGEKKTWKYPEGGWMDNICWNFWKFPQGNFDQI